MRRRAIWNTLLWNTTCEECGLTTRSILHPKGGEQVLRASPAPLDSEASLLASHLRAAVDAFSHVCMICCSAPTSTVQLGMIAVIPPERKPNAAAVPPRAAHARCERAAGRSFVGGARDAGGATARQAEARAAAAPAARRSATTHEASAHADGGWTGDGLDGVVLRNVTM